MKAACAALVAIVAFSGCAPYPPYAGPAPIALVSDQAHLPECELIRREIARQQDVAASSGVMATFLVETSVRLNASNVISGLRTRAAIVGCPA